MRPCASRSGTSRRRCGRTTSAVEGCTLRGGIRGNKSDTDRKSLHRIKSSHFFLRNLRYGFTVGVTEVEAGGHFISVQIDILCITPTLTRLHLEGTVRAGTNAVVDSDRRGDLFDDMLPELFRFKKMANSDDGDGKDESGTDPIMMQANVVYSAMIKMR